MDVTGRAAGKVRQLLAASTGTPGLIYDLTEPESTCRALTGQPVAGTEIAL